LRAIRLFASRIADAIIEGKQVGTEGRTADVQAEVEGEVETSESGAPEIGSLTAIPKEFRGEDEDEDVDIEIEAEEDDEIVAETPEADASDTAESPAAATEETAEESSEAKAS
jgi:hypothetical protein